MSETLDTACGRQATSEHLRAHLPHAPPAYLIGAIANPALGPDDVLALIGNRHVPSSLLARIGRDARWVGRREVRRALVRHPRTPLAIAQLLLAGLAWTDLVEVAGDVRVPPALRRDAGRTLEGRIAAMGVGEKIALARRAGAGLLRDLAATGDGRILRAILGNPRTTEREALAIAASERTPRDVLDWMAEHAAWSSRFGVRHALATNPGTSVPAALRLVEGMERAELDRLSREDSAPRIVRIGAARRLERGRRTRPSEAV